MGRSQLQGTPWHPDQLHKTCKDGSKYCIYFPFCPTSFGWVKGKMVLIFTR